MILFISTIRIYVLWWKSRILWTTFSLLQRREQGEQTLPLLTPVSSCNSSLNSQDDDLTIWQSLACRSYVLVHASFLIQAGRDWTSNCWKLSLTCQQIQSRQTKADAETGEKQSKPPEEIVNNTTTLSSVLLTLKYFFFAHEFPIPFLTLSAASVPTHAPETALKAPALLALLSNSSRELN